MLTTLGIFANKTPYQASASTLMSMYNLSSSSTGAVDPDAPVQESNWVYVFFAAVFLMAIAGMSLFFRNECPKICKVEKKKPEKKRETLSLQIQQTEMPQTRADESEDRPFYRLAGDRV